MMSASSDFLLQIRQNPELEPELEMNIDSDSGTESEVEGPVEVGEPLVVEGPVEVGEPLVVEGLSLEELENRTMFNRVWNGLDSTKRQVEALFQIRSEELISEGENNADPANPEIMHFLRILETIEKLGADTLDLQDYITAALRRAPENPLPPLDNLALENADAEQLVNNYWKTTVTHRFLVGVVQYVQAIWRLREVWCNRAKKAVLILLLLSFLTTLIWDYHHVLTFFREIDFPMTVGNPVCAWQAFLQYLVRSLISDRFPIYKYTPHGDYGWLDWLAEAQKWVLYIIAGTYLLLKCFRILRKLVSMFCAFADAHPLGDNHIHILRR